MMLKTLSMVPLLTAALLAPMRCEAEGIDANPYTGWFHIDRIAFTTADPDYNCVHGVVGRFVIDQQTYSVIDFECDNTIDAVQREDGLLLLVVPNRPERSRLDFDPMTDIDWDSIIDDGTPSPFLEDGEMNWLDHHALHELDPGELFSQNIEVQQWSIDEWTADVTLATSSRLHRIDPQEYDLTYRWFAAYDERRDTECWSVRVQGDLTDVVRWLIANGVHELRTMYRMMDFACVWVPHERVVECRRAGMLLATIDLHN